MSNRSQSNNNDNNMLKYNIKTINQDQDINEKKKALCFFIGSKIRILESTEDGLNGVDGYVVDDTRNSVKIALGAAQDAIVIMKQKLNKIKLDDDVIDLINLVHGKNLKQYYMKPITERIKKISDRIT